MKQFYYIYIALLVLLAATLIFAPKYYDAHRARIEAGAITVTHLNLQGVQEGVYLGEYSLRRVKAAVRVTIGDNRILAIELIEHLHSKGHSGEAVISAVLEQQSLTVDTVSGSTVSSKAILKAIEKALTP
jgi:uncharacterized protein with FMN-binding domain